MDLTEGGELILGCGNTIFESPAFDTLEFGSVGTELLVDVLVPSGTLSGWVGDLQLHIDVPSGQLWNQWVGYHTLNSVSQGIWTTLSFALPQEVREVLLGDYPDARLRVASNVDSCSQGVLFRDVRMGGSLECHPGRAVSDAVVSSSVLTFDSVSDWDVESGSIAGTNAGTQGSGAVELDPTGWGRLVSRSFSTSELTGVSDTMAFDVYIPDLPADFYWLGGMNLFIDCPAAGLWNTWVGYQALQILFDGEFNRVTYPLSPEVANVLQQPSVQCRVALEISSNPAFGGFILDNGGFVQ